MRIVTTARTLLSSRNLAVVAFALWAVSLRFTGFAIVANHRQFSGAEIPGTGWMFPIALNFAWFANPLLLLALAILLFGGSAVILSLLALLLALHTLGESGAASPIHGYGWGLLFWGMSFCVLLAAAGARPYETDPVQSRSFSRRACRFPKAISGTRRSTTSTRSSARVLRVVLETHPSQVHAPR